MTCKFYFLTLFDNENKSIKHITVASVLDFSTIFYVEFGFPNQNICPSFCYSHFVKFSTDYLKIPYLKKKNNSKINFVREYIPTYLSTKFLARIFEEEKSSYCHHSAISIWVG